MKKLFVIALLALGISGVAQEKQARKKSERPEMTVSQKNQLRVKKLALELDLTSQQQKEIAQIIEKKQQERATMMSNLKKTKTEKKQITADERFRMRNEMLDRRIAHKAEMRKVLNKEQYANWENLSKKNMKRKIVKNYSRKKAM